MSDQELRDKLASEYRDEDFKQNPNGYTVAPYVNDETVAEAFSAGWDAARANQVEGWLTQDMGLHVTNIDKLINERDQLKAQCEKLAEALEKYANPDTHSMDKDGEIWYGDYFDYETAQEALAEYRKLKGE